MEEIWKLIPDYDEKYIASNFGKVKIQSNGKLLKLIERGGYYRVVLINKGKYKHVSIHRIVGQLFIPNPENKPQINHIDYDKKNNHVSNLEWCTHNENIAHANLNGRRIGRFKMQDWHKYILQDINSRNVIDESTGVIYSSATEAADKLGFKKSTLIHYLIGSRTNKTTLRYI